MDGRERDLLDKIAELEGLLGKTSSPLELYDAAERASIALDFRGTDAMIGLNPVSGSLLEQVDELIWAARKRAALEGHLESLLRMLSSAWTKRDEKRAEEAAEIGKVNDSDARVAYLLGLYAFHGFGMSKDLHKSRAYHEKAAEQDHADALFELYAMTAQGLGCEADADRAFVYCERAAEAGSSRAMANLGGFYATGRHVKQDDAKAIEWYEKAAERGHGKAAATLGVMYATGQGAPLSLARAKEYFDLAEETGFDWQSFAEAIGLDVDTLFGKKSAPRKPKKAAKKAKAKKAPAKKAAKAATRKSSAKKSTAKKAVAKKAVAKKSVKKGPGKKATAKKAPPKKVKAPKSMKKAVKKGKSSRKA